MINDGLDADVTTNDSIEVASSSATRRVSQLAVFIINQPKHGGTSVASV